MLAKKTVAVPSSSAAAKEKTSSSQKLSYKEQRELEALPAQIEALEQKQAELITKSSDPAFYQQEQGEVSRILAQLKTTEDELQKNYLRWEQLDAMVNKN
jgi:ATP-binding cassette subfamily F protein uup